MNDWFFYVRLCNNMKKTEKEKRNGKILRRFTKMIEGKFDKI